MLKLKVNLNNAYGEDEPVDAATLKEYDAHLTAAGVTYFRRGKVVTYIGTEDQLLQAVFQEYTFFCADGPSFDDDEAMEFIKGRATAA